MSALPRHVRGKRPAFHAEPAIDRLIAMVLALASELSATRDRLATLETLGVGAGWLAPEAIDAHRQSGDERARREAARERLLESLFHVMREEIADLEGDESDAAYWEAIGKIERGEV